MTLRTYLNLMIVATLFAATAWFLVVYYIDPMEAGGMGLGLFYATLFFMLVGVFTVVGFSLRKYLLNNELLFTLIGLSFRQAVWIALIIVGLLIMQGARILNWWDATLLIISISLLEAYFLTE
ncbi:MAG: hypothetical protein U9Q72_01900 [Patescibacteria group bacterium]|nr:hypothetical protein [Patescibacteria group bacterium]